MDEVFGAIVVIAILVLAGIGIAYITIDTRPFSSIEKQCKEQGYIQDNKTRIICKLEEKSK